MDPITLALLGAGISAGGSALGGIFGRQKKQPSPQWLTPPETDMDRTKKALIDDLLASVRGQGSYNDLFNMNDEAFQKSYVDPAKHIFNNQIAPQIQQQYIASGQQRGTGLDDSLARAGVDLDQMLNQQYYQFQNDAQNRKAGGINAILGAQGPQAQLVNGQAPSQSAGSAALQGVGGYFGGGGYDANLSNLLRQYAGKKYDSSGDGIDRPMRRGFENSNY